MLQPIGDFRFYERVGKGGFIFNSSKRDLLFEDLEIGNGESFTSAKTAYRREKSTIFGREGETAWKSVGDGKLAPEVQLTPIPDAFNTSLLETEKNFVEEKTVQGVGLICLTANNKEKTFIAYNDREAGWCDKMRHCQFGGV